MTAVLGLSIGATKMAAVVPGRAATTRQSVLTLYRHRPPEVGVPSENPRLDEPGLVITGFVDRVGDPVGIVAADGSLHRGDVVTADALRALRYAVADGRAGADGPTVTYPAHWSPHAVEALRRALLALPEWSGGVPLVSDAAAALTALRAEPGLPTRGVVALCDFGGTGTGITVVDAANGYQPIGPTVRHSDFSGDLIDQALLKHVIADLPGVDSVDGTSAISSLSRLRAQCRGAKERLSGTTATGLTADLPGHRVDIRLTRQELDNEIEQPLAELMAVLRETLERNRIHPADLAAVASAGGGANIPAITTTLSDHFRVPVITTTRPELTAAEGGALRAAYGPADESATAMAAAAATAAPVAVPNVAEQSGTMRALAWSEVDDAADLVAVDGELDSEFDGEKDYAAPPLTGARPQLQFEPEPFDVAAAGRRVWYRSPIALAAAAVVAVALTAAGVAVAHRSDSAPLSGATTTATGAPPAAAAPQPAAADPQAQQQEPQPLGREPASAAGPGAAAPPADAQAPASAPADPPASVAPATTSDAPTTSDTPTTTTQPPTTTTQPPTTTTQPTTTQPPATTSRPPTTTPPRSTPPVSTSPSAVPEPGPR